MKILLDCCANHNGDTQTIETMIKEAARIGADYVKFQLYESHRLRKDYPDYVERCHGYYKTMLDYPDIVNIERVCKQQGIKSLYTVFNAEVAEQLAQDNGKHDIVKIASSDCNNWELIDTCLHMFKEVIISTGMHEGYQIKQILKRYKGRLHDKITMLFCRSLYPTSNSYDYFDDIHSMVWLRNNFNKWGISDHGDGLDNILEFLRAVSGGSEPDYVERHFILKHDPTKKDDAVSSTPEEAIALTSFPFPLLSESEKDMAKLYIGKWDG